MQGTPKPFSNFSGSYGRLEGSVGLCLRIFKRLDYGAFETEARESVVAD